MKSVVVKSFCVILLSGMFICGCGTTSELKDKEAPEKKEKTDLGKVKNIHESEKDTVKRIADEYMQGIIKAMNENNYKEFSKHFTPEMKKGITKSAFKTMMDKFKAEKGTYKGRQYLGELNQGLFKVYLWKAEYDKPAPKDEKEKVKFQIQHDTLVRLIVGQVDDKYMVFGLWFQ